MKTSLVLPTYNERETLPALIAAFGPLAAPLDLEVVVVDDASPDGTAEVASRLAADGDVPMRLVRRAGKGGLASAVLAGASSSSGRIIAVMDSDGSHPPATLAPLVAALDEGADVAIASRYAGGRITGWPIWRRAASLAATAAARMLFRLRVRDPLSGFFAARREVFTRRTYWGIGFKILLEILARNPELSVKEIPYVFTDRAAGRSKLSLKEVTAYLQLLRRLWRERLA
ncbi:MAG TPA: polyprenol monophosphomannose synthase [bacterium]|nr:polyprenol monophosphomannose synthase [bacterium]